MQITETVPPEVLFRDYVYFSSYSDTMVRHAGELVARLIRERHLGPESLAVEIASNDGYLLKGYASAGIPVLGVEPALNIARVAEERGIRTVAEFFDEALARELRAKHGPADVIHAHNVLAHVADLAGVVRGIGALLREDGVAVIEVPYLRDLVEHCEFDTIYHEHLCYFSVTALDRLFHRHGLVLRERSSASRSMAARFASLSRRRARPENPCAACWPRRPTGEWTATSRSPSSRREWSL